MDKKTIELIQGFRNYESTKNKLEREIDIEIDAFKHTDLITYSEFMEEISKLQQEYKKNNDYLKSLYDQGLNKLIIQKALFYLN